MGNVLDSGMQWLKRQREAHMSTAVAYIRAGAPVSTVQSATIGRKIFRLVDSYGTAIRVETRDYLIGVEQIPDEPQPGDMIDEGGHRYEVTSPGGEPCWEWSDAYRRTRRIHTIHVGDAP